MSKKRFLAGPRSPVRVLAVILALALPGAARGEGDDPQPEPQPTQGEAEGPQAAPGGSEAGPPAAEEPVEESLSHRYQVGVAARAGTGYRVVAPYNDGQDCGQKGKRVCGGLQPPWLEVSPSFGVTRGLEVLLDVRLSLLDDEISSTKAIAFAPGIKYYGMPDGVFKIFVTGQLFFEYQDMAGADLSTFDFALRCALGLHFDINRYVGLYLQGGILLGLARWLTFHVDGGGGLQLRY